MNVDVELIVDGKRTVRITRGWFLVFMATYIMFVVCTSINVFSLIGSVSRLERCEEANAERFREIDWVFQIARPEIVTNGVFNIIELTEEMTTER